LSENPGEEDETEKTLVGPFASSGMGFLLYWLPDASLAPRLTLLGYWKWDSISSIFTIQSSYLLIVTQAQPNLKD